MKQALLLLIFSLFALTTFGQQTAYAGNPGEGITIYPNPATDYIGLNHAEAVAEVHVYNLVGKRMKVFRVSNPGDRFFIGDLPKGLYLLRMMDVQEQVLTTKRLNKR